MKSVFFLFFKVIYGIVFSAIIAILLLFENVGHPCKKTFIISNSTIFLIVVAIILIGAGCYYRYRSKNRLLNRHTNVNIDKLVLAATAVLFLGQCYVFYNVFFLSGWDARMVRGLVDTLFTEGNPAYITAYFSRYPNNLFISYFFLLIRNINKYFGIFSGDYSYMCIVVLNCIINSFSCLLSYKTARIFAAPFLSLAAYFLCVFSVGISGWTVVGYSDALALFLPVLSVYLYCKHYKSERMKTIGLIAIGIISAIGYFIKPQCLFVLLAIVIIESIKSVEKFSLRALVRPAVLCLVAFVAFSTTNMGVDALNEKYGMQIDEEKTFGIVHFLMMGANEERNGTYSLSDVEFSDSFDNAEERSKANIEVFKERITGMKSGIIMHFIKKILTTFNDGTFAWGNEGSFFLVVPEAINNKMAPFLQSIYHMGWRFEYFATFQHFVWIVILVCTLFTVFSKKEKGNYDKLSLFWIVLLGFVLYEMLFEVRARYIYIFVPILCSMVPVGIKNIGALAVDLIPNVKNRIERIAEK